MKNGGACTANTNTNTMAAADSSDIEKQQQQLDNKTKASESDGGDGESCELIQVVVVDNNNNNNKAHQLNQPQTANSPSHDECRVCQEENNEVLINLGCQCRGGLAKAHQSCITKWFTSRGSNKCEICQQIAANVAPPGPQTNYWIWRVDPALRTQERGRGCFSPLWVAFSILIGGLLLDVLISVTLGVSALPINIVIGVIVVLGLGTALRLALEFCQEWNVRRVVQRVETNSNLVYHPAL